jgi:hypothetical protein
MDRRIGKPCTNGHDSDQSMYMISAAVEIRLTFLAFSCLLASVVEGENRQVMPGTTPAYVCLFQSRVPAEHLPPGVGRSGGGSLDEVFVVFDVIYLDEDVAARQNSCCGNDSV